jgi:hypothetical protein
MRAKAGLFVSALSLLLIEHVAAATIMSVTSAPGLPVVSIDSSTGAVRRILNTNLATIFFELSAFDPVTRQLYVVSGDTQQLVVIDLNGNFVTSKSIAIPGSYIFFEWDPASRRILAATSEVGLPVVSIDPATGVIQRLLNTNVTSVAFHFSAFDPVTRRLYLLSAAPGTQKLIIVDLLLNTVSEKSITIAANYVFFEWDALGRRILAVTSAAGLPVVAIDPVTGSVQTLLNTNVESASFGFSAFDPVSHQLYFLSGDAGAQQLVVVDLPSKTVATKLIAIPDNYVFFELLLGPPESIPALSATYELALICSLALVALISVQKGGMA